MRSKHTSNFGFEGSSAGEVSAPLECRTERLEPITGGIAGFLVSVGTAAIGFAPVTFLAVTFLEDPDVEATGV